MAKADNLRCIRTANLLQTRSTAIFACHSQRRTWALSLLSRSLAGLGMNAAAAIPIIYTVETIEDAIAYDPLNACIIAPLQRTPPTAMNLPRLYETPNAVLRICES